MHHNESRRKTSGQGIVVKFPCYLVVLVDKRRTGLTGVPISRGRFWESATKTTLFDAHQPTKAFPLFCCLGGCMTSTHSLLLHGGLVWSHDRQTEQSESEPSPHSILTSCWSDARCRI